MNLNRKALAYFTAIAISIISIAVFLHYPMIFYCDRGNEVSSRANLPSSPSLGIGFDLTAFYGTAIISFPNGSVTHVAKIEASSDYRKAMARLSLESSKHPAPPYNNAGDAIADYPRQRLRRARKAIGLAASEDVAIISTVIKDLQNRTEDYLGYKISTAVATTPHLVALYEEDIADAFEYVGLQFESLPYWRTLVVETAAAYAGYGIGLCTNYTNPSACNAEQRSMPTEDIMAVLYTKQALTVTLSKIQSVLWLWEPRYRFHEDFTLGHHALENGPKQDHYWEYVREALMQIMVINPYYPKPSKVLLMGECANDETFRSVLEDALGSLMENMPEIFSQDAEFVAAKGAGELAKRAPYDIRLLTLSPSEILDDVEGYAAERLGEAAAQDSRQRDLMLDFRVPTQRPLTHDSAEI